MWIYAQTDKDEQLVNEDSVYFGVFSQQTVSPYDLWNPWSELQLVCAIHLLHAQLTNSCAKFTKTVHMIH